MRKRTPKLLAFALAAVMTMGMTVSAAEIDRNEEGQTIDVPFGDTLIWNWGTVRTNNGTVKNNYGIVENNCNIVENNYGTVKNPTGGSLVLNNFGGDVEGGAIDQY